MIELLAYTEDAPVGKIRISVSRDANRPCYLYRAEVTIDGRNHYQTTVVDELMLAGYRDGIIEHIKQQLLRGLGRYLTGAK